MRHAIVALLCTSAVILAVPSSADVACTGSDVSVTARGGLDALAVTWHLTPTCDVVETGLLVGQDRGTLTADRFTSHRMSVTWSYESPWVRGQFVSLSSIRVACFGRAWLLF